MRKASNCQCLVCFKLFYKSSWYLKNGKGKYCSKACMNIGMSQQMKGRQITWADKISKAHQGSKKPWSKLNSERLKGIKRSEEFKEKCRKRMIGKRCALGTRRTIVPDDQKVTPIQEMIRKTTEYKIWRKSVFDRDNHTCVICKIRGGVLNADHIIPFAKIFHDNNIKGLADAYSIEMLWDVNNGRTLCESCHKKTESYGVKYMGRKVLLV